MTETGDKKPSRLPLLAVRDLVVFPHMSVPLSVGRQKSIKALEAAVDRGITRGSVTEPFGEGMPPPGTVGKRPASEALGAAGKLVAVTAQKRADIEEPQTADMYPVGVVAEVAQFLRMPDGTLKVFLQGLTRARLVEPCLLESGYWETGLSYGEESWTFSAKLEALTRQALTHFETLSRMRRNSPPEAVNALRQIADPSRLCDTLAAHAILKHGDRQSLLEIEHPEKRLERLVELLEAELEIGTLERRIHTRVQSQIQKNQKEYYLTEQMKAIQKELRQKDDFAKELDELRAKVVEAKMPPAALEASLKDLERLSKMMPFSPEATVCRTYLDWMVSLPWSKKTRDNLDIRRAAAILDEDHYGLEKAKDRVLEYLAVCRLTRKLRGPILCFVGPPGVGKTSMGRSIARAMNRRFARVALGGVRDEAELRGHRRTYIGSLPGRILQSMRKAKSRNPVFLLDEIDKMGMDWRGDPAAALLEVLDPEQNATFVDHYLDVEFDLSSVMFLCTANSLDGIPVALQDRLEIIRFPGYTQREKLSIAKEFLIPKQLCEHGLKPGRLAFQDAALLRIIQEYTREAGVRSLEREIAQACRKSARRIVEDASERVDISAADLPKSLGVPKYPPEESSHNAVGVSTGLAWTEAGGTLLAVEVLSYPGKGEIQLTGKLGTVMQESAKAALSYVRSRASALGIAPSLFKNVSFHIHVPEGAVPKDGPSAGTAIAAALASHLTGRAVLAGVAMTGEITLQGRVLAIGGLKEKVLAAHRQGIKTVLFPKTNTKDLEEIPKEVLSELEMTAVDTLEDVFARSLAPERERPKRRASVWAPAPKRAEAPGYTAPRA